MRIYHLHCCRQTIRLWINNNFFGYSELWEVMHLISGATKCFSILSICIMNPSDSHESCESTDVLLFNLLGVSLTRASLIDFTAIFLTLLSGLRAPGINSSNFVMTSASRQLLVIIKLVAAWPSRKKCLMETTNTYSQKDIPHYLETTDENRRNTISLFFVSRNDKQIKHT